MESKIMLVFYGNDCLPYKDKERQVHYPIVGSAFLGASDTTKIRFYFDRIGDPNIAWVAVAKLPNGKQGSKVLSVYNDTTLNERYCELSLDSWFTQAKGDVYIALQGYQGGVQYSYDSESELYTITGTPTIQTTGSVKLAINYAPIGDVADYNDEFATYQQILAALGDKISEINGIIVVNDVLQIADLSEYQSGQVFYSIADGGIYKLNSGTLQLLDFFLNVKNGVGSNSIQQKLDTQVVDFTNRNSNATTLDPTLATEINTGASGDASASFNGNTMALGKRSLANGNKTISKGQESHAEGYQSVSLGDGSHAEGSQTVAQGLQSHSEGALTQSLGDSSHAEGHSTIAGGLASHAEGVNTKVGTFSQPSGVGADQSGTPGGGGGQPQPTPPYVATDGEGSHAEGYDNVITKCGTHAEGLKNYTSGKYSHIEGVNNTSSADYNHTEGYNNINSGDCSHVSGVWNNNSGYGASVKGFYNKNTRDYKTVGGKFNEDKYGTLLEIGNGTDDTHRKNAFEVHEDGRATIGANPENNLDVATKNYVDTQDNLKQDKLIVGYGLQLVGGVLSCTITGFTTQVVQSLPSTGENGVIYLVPLQQTATQNIYAEYIWVSSSNTYEKLGEISTGADLTDYPKKDEDETITGDWTFDGTLNPNGDGYGVKLPSTSGLSGNKTLATTDQTYNFINASDIVDSTLTQSQFDLLTNGKPTLISSGFLGKETMFVFNSTSTSGGYIKFLYKTERANGRQEIGCFRVAESTKVCTNYPSYVNQFIFFDKQLPSFPSSPSTPQVITYGTDNTLSWGNVSGFKIMPAPSSTTLTDDEIAQIIQGVQINGLFAALSNPQLGKALETTTTYYGTFLASNNSGNTFLGTYQINKTTKSFNWYSNFYISTNGTVYLNGKPLPSNPSSTGTFVNKMINGTLSWSQEWTGTQEQYDALGTYDSNTTYYIVEE